jgi:hypothetical protein
MSVLYFAARLIILHSVDPLIYNVYNMFFVGILE